MVTGLGAVAAQPWLPILFLSAHRLLVGHMSETIAFIGGGNMATSLIGGLVNAKYPVDNILVAEPNAERRGWLHHEFGVQVTEENALAAAADAVVLAVKPQVMRDVLLDMAPAIKTHKPLLISVAAGLRVDTLQRWADGLAEKTSATPLNELAIVRCMPNTPALVGAGASGLYANSQVSAAQRMLAESLLRGSGLALWVDAEADLDAVTAVSGSGPAYYFAFMEAMQTAAEHLGLPAETARLLTLETAFGAAKMALESADEPGVLRQKVTSPNGTTEQALQVFSEHNLSATVAAAMQAAAKRADSLANELDV